jgi:hypothetical protein
MGGPAVSNGVETSKGEGTSGSARWCIILSMMISIAGNRHGETRPCKMPVRQDRLAVSDKGVALSIAWKFKFDYQF